MKKIRCSECGGIIALEIEPITEKGEISIMCNNRKPNGKRCKTINLINRKSFDEE
jgi:phage FluMu protein Com